MLNKYAVSETHIVLSINSRIKVFAQSLSRHLTIRWSHEIQMCNIVTQRNYHQSAGKIAEIVIRALSAGIKRQ